MTPHAGTRNVGAIDPKLKTSPVLEETAEESYEPRHHVPDPSICFFNGEVFATGEFVRTGAAVLKCQNGVWVEVGPADPDNP